MPAKRVPKVSAINLVPTYKNKPTNPIYDRKRSSALKEHQTPILITLPFTFVYSFWSLAGFVSIREKCVPILYTSTFFLFVYLGTKECNLNLFRASTSLNWNKTRRTFDSSINFCVFLGRTFWKSALILPTVTINFFLLPYSIIS